MRLAIWKPRNLHSVPTRSEFGADDHHANRGSFAVDTCKCTNWPLTIERAWNGNCSSFFAVVEFSIWTPFERTKIRLQLWVNRINLSTILTIRHLDLFPSSWVLSLITTTCTITWWVNKKLVIQDHLVHTCFSWWKRKWFWVFQWVYLQSNFFIYFNFKCAFTSLPSYTNYIRNWV